MEALTRLVSESFARHGFDRPLDYRRLHWSRWFRCESHHSLLLVPSKPGVFAIAEEITRVGANAFVRSASEASASPPDARRMLAVTQFFEDDDMAFVLDRMLSYPNVMRERLNSGRYFVRFVVIEDVTQRRSICSALNQWMVSTAEKATGIGLHFASSLELTPATEFIPQQQRNDAQSSLFDFVDAATARVGTAALGCPAERSSAATVNPSPDTLRSTAASHLDSGAAANIHCPSPLPSGF